jgi:hypothetical protein
MREMLPENLKMVGYWSTHTCLLFVCFIVPFRWVILSCLVRPPAVSFAVEVNEFSVKCPHLPLWTDQWKHLGI